MEGPTELCCGMLGCTICLEGRVVACKAVLSLYRVVLWHVRFFSICIEGRVIACKTVLSASEDRAPALCLRS